MGAPFRLPASRGRPAHRASLRMLRAAPRAQRTASHHSRGRGTGFAHRAPARESHGGCCRSGVAAASVAGARRGRERGVPAGRPLQIARAAPSLRLVGRAPARERPRPGPREPPPAGDVRILARSRAGRGSRGAAGHARGRPVDAALAVPRSCRGHLDLPAVRLERDFRGAVQPRLRRRGPRAVPRAVLRLGGRGAPHGGRSGRSQGRMRSAAGRAASDRSVRRFRGADAADHGARPERARASCAVHRRFLDELSARRRAAHRFRGVCQRRPGRHRGLARSVPCDRAALAASHRQRRPSRSIRARRGRRAPPDRARGRACAARQAARGHAAARRAWPGRAARSRRAAPPARRGMEAPRAGRARRASRGGGLALRRGMPRQPASVSRGCLAAAAHDQAAVVRGGAPRPLRSRSL